MNYRFIIYGLLGWTMEILWTGLGSMLMGDYTLRGVSYLWMFPVYGMAVFLEPVHERVKGIPWYARGIIWTFLIFGLELTSGLFIKLLVGVIPWDYSGSPFSVAGVIRLDYAPVWFVVGLMFERVHDFLKSKLD